MSDGAPSEPPAPPRPDELEPNRVPASPSPPSADQQARRRAAAVLGAATVLAPAVVIFACWNPWHLVWLQPLGRLWIASLMAIAIPIALGTAGSLLIPNRDWAFAVRILAGVAAFIVAFPECGVIYFAILFNEGPDTETVAAISPDRRVEVVAIENMGLGSYYTYLLLRSRRGPLSQRSDRDVACFERGEATWSTDFDSARFLDNHELEVRVQDGRTFQVAIDRTALRPTTTLSWCWEEHPAPHVTNPGDPPSASPT